MYPYALCPAQPAVQRYILGLVEDASRLPGITGLDIEALSFMGYDHNSLHDKRAVPVPAELNNCHCSECRGEGGSGCRGGRFARPDRTGYDAAD